MRGQHIQQTQRTPYSWRGPHSCSSKHNGDPSISFPKRVKSSFTSINHKTTEGGRHTILKTQRLHIRQ